MTEKNTTQARPVTAARSTALDHDSDGEGFLGYGVATEYRRAYGYEPKEEKGDGNGEGVSGSGSCVKVTEINPHFMTTLPPSPRRPASSNNIFSSSLKNDNGGIENIKTDWTTSYMRDFTLPKTSGDSGGRNPPINLTESDSVKKLLRHTKFLPNPISEEKKCIDDDENSNPTTKNFMDLVAASRK